MVVVLTLLGVGAAVLLGAAVGVHVSDYYSAKARTLRKEASAHAAWLNRMHKKCVQARDVEPFAASMADEIMIQILRPLNKD